MKIRLNRNIIRALLLVLVTWLMTGLAVDDEFSNEYRIFLKYRPTFQYYFKSPLSMQDMPADYPVDKAVDYYTYRDFVWEEHWLSGLDGVAVCMVLFCLFFVLYTGYHLKRNGIMKNKVLSSYRFF